MFFFIGGIQPKTKRLEKYPRLCPVCGQTRVFRKRTDSYLSLFFIPLFPVKKGLPFSTCENCSTAFKQDGSRIDISDQRTIKRCRHCGSQVTPDFFYCPYCGHTL